MSVKKIHPIWLLLTCLIIFRLITLNLYPLIDTTEARYGEMARIMVETNNWVTPQFDYGVPFWGKPPMHTWASALSAKMFGVSEFSLRIPHLLAGIFTLVCIGTFAHKLKISVQASILVLCSSLGFFAASGMIMTDSLLLLGMTMAMAGFFIAWRDKSKRPAYIGFVGIAIGLLAKGPIILVLIGLAILPWVIINYGVINGAKSLFTRIPMMSGLAITCVLTVPWYLLAEQATPGFLNYFLVGEHFLRFVQSGWEGDLYGTAHSEPRGIIWLYWLVVAFPWSFYVGALLLSKNKRRQLIKDRREAEINVGLTSFLVCWLISPMLLFTLSGNILPIYVLPGIPALAVLTAKLVQRVSFSIVMTSLLTPIVLIAFLVIGLPNMSENRSDKQLLASIEPTLPVYYIGERTFSGRFYSQGRAKNVESISKLAPLKQPTYLVVTSDKVEQAQLSFVCDIKAKNKRRSLLLCKA